MNDTITAEQEERRTVRLTPAEYFATVEKIDKINTRAAKRGFTGRFELRAERVQTTEMNSLGFKITKVYFDVEVTGEAPRYNGWTFLARVDRVEDSFTLATAPGVEHVDRSLVRVGECDHCGQSRHRNNTYLVVNESGEVRNVGSTCINDFLGWDGKVVFYTERDVIDEDELGGGGVYWEDSYDVETIVAAAYGAIRAFGFVRSDDYYAEPTKEVVKKIVGAIRPTRDEEKALAPARAYAVEANEKAATIRAWILSDEFSGTSTYVDNLKAAAAANVVGVKHIGLLASAPQAYIRHLETAAERTAKEARWAAEKAATATSDYLGAEGDKIEVKGTVDAIRYIEGNYGTTVLYTIRTAEGNLVKWFASREALGDKEGVEVHVKATIKKLDDYQGSKSTVITRAKAL